MGFKASEHMGDDDESGERTAPPETSMTSGLLGGLQAQFDALARTSASQERDKARFVAREQRNVAEQIADREREEAERPKETRRKTWTFRLAVWGAITGTLSMLGTAALLWLALDDDESSAPPPQPAIDRPVPGPAQPPPPRPGAPTPIVPPAP